MECSVCRLCSTCCARDAKCNPNIAPATQFSTPQNPFGNPLSVPFPTTSTTSVTAPKDCFPVRDHPNFSPTVYPPESLLQVPNMFKEHRSTVSGAYFASQSLWRNGFPVYIQAPLPNQKEPFVVEFHMRPKLGSADSLAATPQPCVGVWELKAKDRSGTAFGHI